jgi:hypothetical protein
MKYESNPQSAAWFIKRFKESGLILRPGYQRKTVWTLKEKSSLMESMLLGFPIPEIYIHRDIGAGGEELYAVVDGQQRISTLVEFVGADKNGEYHNFSLDKLPEASPFFGLRFSDLSEDQQKAFLRYTFAVRMLDVEEESQLREAFIRLNKFLAPLKPQELRNALFTGAFARLAEEKADDEFWLENRIVTPAAIRRMNDVEFVSELLIAAIHGPQAGSARGIDQFYELYAEYEDDFPDKRRMEKVYDSSLKHLKDLCPDIRNTRWANKTDLYSLFGAVAHFVRADAKFFGESSTAQKALSTFARKVDRRLANEGTDASRNVVDYVRAVEKGANDKARRGIRHQVLVTLLSKYFKS